MLRRFAGAFLLLVGCGVPLPQPIDDAGRPDAAVTLVDAGSFDAGTVDAGVHDAGPIDAGPMDAGSPDSGAPDAGPPDSGSPDAGPPDAGFIDLVTVGHQREMRGVWVASVSNLDFPLSTGQTPDAGRAALKALVDRTADAGLNSLFFQIRPESDALYESSLEPWSRFLTGTQGQNPGWDPLETLLNLAHSRGIEVHAWVNPYRASVSASSTTASNHVTHTLSSHAITYNGATVMDPGSPQVRAHVVDVIRDVLNRYDVDGLHFDDYFYPYPDSSSTPFPDGVTYAGYQADGGTLTLANWRRDNVNGLVREVMHVITQEHPQVRFGISPFGIFKSGTPSGIVGLSAYDAIYCDAPSWMSEGTVDYLAPQLYWPRSPAAQAFGTLINWWASGTSGGRHIFAGHGLYRLGATSAWTTDEIRQQVALVRAQRAQGALGSIHFRDAQVRLNTLGVTDLFRTELYATPALPPPIPRAGSSMTPLPPLVQRTGNTLQVQHPLPMTVRFSALYRFVAGQWVLTAVSGDPIASFANLASGTYAVSAIARGGAESQGVRLSVP